jgi:glycosyltransferase involved in cell wall biosynthesis
VYKKGKKTLCIDLRWIDSSGVGVYIKGILPGIVQKLEQFQIVGLGDRTRLESFAWSGAPNVRLVDCKAKRYSLAEQVQLPRSIPPDTDLFFSPYYTIPLLYRGRLAVTVHDMSHLVVPEIVNDRKKRIYAQIMFRALRRRAAIIFTVSRFSKSELLRLTTGTREESILPTHLGISPKWFEASKSPALRSRPYFVCVGNIKPYKNVGRLIEAFISVKDRIEHDLVIVGQSEGLITGESPRFFKQVREAGRRVHMTGFVTEGELLSLVGHAQGLVMPSLYEGFGLPPLEAMAAGVPVAVARSASLPEVCGEAALYFDPLDVEDIGNCLVELATNHTLWRQLKAMGLERSREFTWDSCASLTAGALDAELKKN